MESEIDKGSRLLILNMFLHIPWKSLSKQVFVQGQNPPKMYGFMKRSKLIALGNMFSSRSVHEI